MEKILLIEDEEPISELIKINLSMVGYDIYQAFDGAAGLQFIKNNEFDLVILDIMLPEIDGYSLLPDIIKRDIPVIIVTARDNLKDKVKGFNLGADDYITKPFEGIELIARVKAVLKRSGKTKCINETGFDDIRIIYDQRKVYKESCEIELTMKEYELLKILIENKGIVLSREKLLELVWEYNYEGNTRTVDMHIQRLRNKLHTERIKTVYKIGYRLETV
jgi:DNA-binding response OmpR family regulator